MPDDPAATQQASLQRLRWLEQKLAESSTEQKQNIDPRVVQLQSLREQRGNKQAAGKAQLLEMELSLEAMRNAEGTQAPEMKMTARPARTFEGTTKPKERYHDVSGRPAGRHALEQAMIGALYEPMS